MTRDDGREARESREERSSLGTLQRHLDDTRAALDQLATALPALQRWARTLRARLGGGSRLLVAGNGGSAALAQHLTSELVGRYAVDRPAYSALALHAETSALTAIGNDYGFELCFARQVEAHGRPGDVLLALSTSGRSPNLLQAVHAARRRRMLCWAMTGDPLCPLGALCDEHVALGAATTASVQEAQQVAVHLLCEAFDAVGAVPVAPALPFRAVAG